MTITRDNCADCGQVTKGRCMDCGRFACGNCQRHYHNRCRPAGR